MCLDFPGLTLWLPTLRQQPCHWFVASYRLCLLYPVCFSCHQIRGCDWLQGAGPCCLAVRCYSLFRHSLRWSIWAIWRCYCSSCNACGSSRSKCGTWNPRAVGQVNKTHMVLWILDGVCLKDWRWWQQLAGLPDWRCNMQVMDRDGFILCTPLELNLFDALY